eukprot:TRINITY_DN9770_c0_g1_i1.p2 TRINITY_DN9770_c0_g1~~TRINITY_DN9770_c0_g1_i1.p2  ORF type:complete len:122 (+),score=13.24 TRINITY_DN9770_c0_g1_i1:293-658(+)
MILIILSKLAFILPLQKNNLDLAKIFLKIGADVNAIDQFSKTPLYYALQNENTTIAKLLLAYQASPWSTSECMYEVAYNNNELKALMKKAQGMQILVKMNPNQKDREQQLKIYQESLLQNL